MSNEFNPTIDQWYQVEKGDLLRVVAVDEDLVEVQYFDGSVEELDIDTWREMDIELAEEPEDWTGPFDDIEDDDLGDADITATGQDLRSVDASQGEEQWQDTRPEDERDVIDEDDLPVEPYVSEEQPGLDL
jgi:hypothetical protein